MKALLTDIRELVLSARKAVVHSVDLIQVLTNFEIGRRIIKHDSRARSGPNTAKRFSRNWLLT